MSLKEMSMHFSFQLQSYTLGISLLLEYEVYRLFIGYTVNDYRTIIGRFIRKSFVIFVYR